MSTELALWLFVPSVLWLAWRYCALWYRRVYGVGLKWWAVPFAQGALILAMRLPAKWERP